MEALAAFLNRLDQQRFNNTIILPQMTFYHQLNLPEHFCYS